MLNSYFLLLTSRSALRIGWLWSGRLDLRFPGIGVGGGFGGDAEIVGVEVHSFFFHHFDDGVFPRREAFGGSQFQPTSRELRGGGLHEVLLLSYFAADLAFEIPENALVALDFNAEDTIAIGDGRLRLWRALCLLVLCHFNGIGRRVDVEVERR